MRKVIFIFLILLVSILSGEEQIGLALSGGGARALAHIGVLKVLEEENIDIKYISGTSTGALIGALYSIGYSATEIEEILLKIDWREIISDKISRSKAPISQKRWKPVANAFFPLNERFQPELPKAIFAGNNIVNELFRLTYSISHKKNYYEFPIGFSCIATDFMSGDKVVFTEGFLHQSIRASMSFPTIFEPFEIDGKIYVDGGLNDNLPVEQVKSMGADYIIASCSTSGLKARDDVNSVLDVLDQTVNFQINSNVKESAIKADLLIEPDLEDIDKLEFDKIREIIAAGERAARIYLERIRQLPKSKEEKDIDYLPSKIKFHHIKVKGNKYLSSSKIKEYLHLKKGELYSLEDISNAFEMVYNSDLFEYIYPAIEQSEVGNYQLIIFVKEKNRKRIGVSFSYNEENEFNAGLTMELNNYLQRNSKILINFKFGSDTQANIDYAKNFGRLFGIYFRLFPNYQEKVIYSYNEEHEKMSSVKSSELGINGGIGVFVNNIFDFEVYGFTNRTRIYRNIAEFETQHYQMTGIGAKIYAETLDDYVFPMSGAELIAKLTGAREDYYSYEGFTKFYSRFRLLFPFLDGISIKYGFEYGSFLDKKDIEIDPFYIGGIDSFLGLKKQEMSAPVFKIHLLSLRMKVFRNIFFDIQYNRMNLGNSDIWLPEKNIYQAIGLKVGFRNFIGPVRAAFAVDQDRKSNFYLSIGYEFDAFEFSRR